MLNIEIRPLGWDGALMEAGTCVGCRQPLPNPLSVPERSHPAPVLLFLDSPNPDDNFQGLCPGCMHDVATMVRYLPDTLR